MKKTLPATTTRKIERNKIRMAMGILGVKKPNKMLNYFWKNPKERRSLLKKAKVA